MSFEANAERLVQIGTLFGPLRLRLRQGPSKSVRKDVSSRMRLRIHTCLMWPIHIERQVVSISVRISVSGMVDSYNEAPIMQE